MAKRRRKGVEGRLVVMVTCHGELLTQQRCRSAEAAGQAAEELAEIWQLNGPATRIQIHALVKLTDRSPARVLAQAKKEREAKQHG